MLRFDVGGRRGLALALLGTVWCGTARAETRILPPAGHLRSLAAHRVAAAPVIDGALSDPRGRSGPRPTSSGCRSGSRRPRTRRGSSCCTTTRRCISPLRASMGGPTSSGRHRSRATAAPGLDDRITVELDPFHNHRSLSSFTVTARGTQSDAIAGGRARKWKGEWHAAAQRTSLGWTAEIAIPLASWSSIPALILSGSISAATRTGRANGVMGGPHAAEAARRGRAPHRPAAAADHRGEQPGAVMQYPVEQPAALAPTRPGREPHRRRRPLPVGPAVLPQCSRPSPTSAAWTPKVAGVGFSYTEKYVADRRPFFQEGQAFFGDPRAVPQRPHRRLRRRREDIRPCRRLPGGRAGDDRCRHRTRRLRRPRGARSRARPST